MESKTILLTGASTGIGAHAAKHLVSIGYRKLALVARTKDLLEEVAKECRARGATDVLVLAKDLTVKEQCVEAVDETVKHFGEHEATKLLAGLDILICNAGGTSHQTPVRDLKPETFDFDLALNLTAPFIMTKHSLPHLEKTKGNVLYVSSVAATIAMPGLASYCTAKAGLDQLARVVALEEASKGVRVNVLSPGGVWSGIHRKMGITDSQAEQMKEHSKGVHPIGRIGELQEMSNIIAFLISPENSFMTGTIVRSDGGMSLTSSMANTKITP